ncbi:MAG: hypothetical protein IIX37_08825 [Selenomonadaceae bacterium]|nr:hypothetical protein [Selenomonadaceae bacterium]
MQTMQKISYINQMNGFLDRMSEDTLPANAVMLYLMLFKSFNRTCWRQEWLKFTIQQLMVFANVGSPNTVYNMRRLLKELGYIDYRPAQNGNRSQTEYRLLPLPGNAAASFSPIAYAKNEHSASEYSKNERSITECSDSENSQAKSQPKVPENHNLEPVLFSENEYSKIEHSAEFSVECSLSENKTENSPIGEEEEKKRYTTHVTTVTDQAEKKNINNGSSNSNCHSIGNNTANAKVPMTVNEFCQNSGDYQLCQDAYMDYFKREPPSADKVKLLRFLAEYGTDSTLKAMDVMMRNKAESLNYCEGVLRRMQWQLDKNTARRPAPRPHSDWQGWNMA